MKKLYRVEVTTELFAVGEDEADAQRAAIDAVREDDGGFTLRAFATQADSVPRSRKGAYPYGDSNDEPCEVWLQRTSSTKETP